MSSTEKKESDAPAPESALGSSTTQEAPAQLASSLR